MTSKTPFPNINDEFYSEQCMEDNKSEQLWDTKQKPHMKTEEKTSVVQVKLMLSDQLSLNPYKSLEDNQTRTFCSHADILPA